MMKLKKDELVERAKAGVATSGTKADIVARLLGELNHDALRCHRWHGNDQSATDEIEVSRSDNIVAQTDYGPVPILCVKSGSNELFIEGTSC